VLLITDLKQLNLIPLALINKLSGLTGANFKDKQTLINEQDFIVGFYGIKINHIR
jgi:hypothetical protein